LTAEPFREALVDWMELRRVSPAGDPAVTEPVGDEEARRLFREGQVALLLSRTPPTVDPSSRESASLNKAISVVSLPGSEKVTNPKTQSGDTEEKLNSCVHLATTGWYLAFGKADPVPAAVALFRFLCHAKETEFLVQAARHGIAPARTALLDQPERFTGYRMAAGTTQRWFGLLRNELSAENWIADLRTSNAPELNAALALQLQRALKGEAPPEAALEAANNEWKRIIANDQKKFLEEYRQSLGLPSLIP
jgi:ABC-type glycerol-3-phosphate transport system substrate-binding protein